MQILRTPDSVRVAARRLDHPLGFVPTMGALHEGHAALVRRARAENPSVACSLFVNSLQFAPGEDFERYPRSFDRDIEMLEGLGVDLLYAPEHASMYPQGFATRVDVGPLALIFDGVVRPGHFAGSATVVLKLLDAIEPSVLYLGQKDAQQVAVLRRMIADLDVPVSIVVHPIVRESDGLALSSRNVYLSPELRAAAPSLYNALCESRDLLRAGVPVAQALARGRGHIANSLEVEYFALVDPDTFDVLELVRPPALLIAVVRAGQTRLLDNLAILGAEVGDAEFSATRAKFVESGGSR